MDCAYIERNADGGGTQAAPKQRDKVPDLRVIPDRDENAGEEMVVGAVDEDARGFCTCAKSWNTICGYFVDDEVVDFLWEVHCEGEDHMFYSGPVSG